MRVSNLLSVVAGLVAAGALAAIACRPVADPAVSDPDIIPVYVVRFFPTAGDSIDRAVTGDWGAPLAFTRRKTDSLTARVEWALEEGSRFRAYSDPGSRPALDYRIVGDTAFLEPLPTRPRPRAPMPMTDYRSIMDRIDGRRLVEDRGIQEIWIWGYHGGVLDLWESNMAGPFGDVSNSDRDTTDLPVFSRTYTVYHYNYQRGAAEAVENHMHQLEHLLNWFDGRDTTPPSRWSELLFWGRFVGSDSTHRLVPPIRAGWSHYPPNASRDYEWENPEPVETDIEDWTPDRSGRVRAMGCEAWDCDHLGWFIYWMQSMPGPDNGLHVDGRPLRNWWRFVSDFDTASREAWRLWIDPVPE